MSRLYVFCIGGTGSRVLKSLTMLLASGVQMGNFNEIVPIILDPDRAGGDVNLTEEILQGYQDIRKYIGSSTKCNFFKVRIRSLENVLGQDGSQKVMSDGFRAEIDGTRAITFKDFIGYDSLPHNDPNKYITELLFSESNLNSDLDVGFKGNPNMGSVVLNSFAASRTLLDFASSFNKGDRIFIISSIFGGTGAAGFPLLLKTLKQGNIGGKHFADVQKAEISAITVQPYFNPDFAPSSKKKPQIRTRCG